MTPDLSLEGQPGISKRKKGEGVSPQASGMCGVGGGWSCRGWPRTTRLDHPSPDGALLLLAGPAGRRVRRARALVGKLGKVRAKATP